MVRLLLVRPPSDSSVAVLKMYSKCFLFQEFLNKSDANKSGDLNRQEFFDYLRQHERQLRVVFTSIDENKDGKSSKTLQ